MAAIFPLAPFPIAFGYRTTTTTSKAKVKMGQAPGTHWYHAHIHGSTALNVANGMTGAFIIEGPYDDALREFYKDEGNTLEEKVLVIQQLETSLKPVERPRAFAPASLIREWPAPAGHHHAAGPGPDVAYREWSPRTFVQFLNFVHNHPSTKLLRPCSNTETPCVDWRQTAQDGVQFASG